MRVTSRYMEALLNNISHYGEMSKTAHHLFSGVLLRFI